jgi:hypothetical protein
MNIPNLPVAPITDEKGFRSPVELVFMQQLITELQQNAGQEGLVAPTLTASQITTVQNNQLPNGTYSCSFGTIVYNVTANSIMIAINSGSPDNKPIFKTVTLT